MYSNLLITTFPWYSILMAIIVNILYVLYTVAIMLTIKVLLTSN